MVVRSPATRRHTHYPNKFLTFINRRRPQAIVYSSRDAHLPGSRAAKHFPDVKMPLAISPSLCYNMSRDSLEMGMIAWPSPR